MKELYVSTDIEADGKCPGLNSMLSFASVVFDGVSEEPVAQFTANLELLRQATPDPDTEAFWAKNKKAYNATRENTLPATVAMRNYARWLKSLKGKPVFVGYPAAFDSLFVFWYLHQFAGENPFGWQAIDIKSYAMAMLQIDFKNSVKSNYPKEWFSETKLHTHVAVDDAIEQGILFTRMLKANRKAAGRLSEDLTC